MLPLISHRFDNALPICSPKKHKTDQITRRWTMEKLDQHQTHTEESSDSTTKQMKIYAVM